MLSEKIYAKCHILEIYVIWVNKRYPAIENSRNIRNIKFYLCEILKYEIVQVVL